MKRKLQFGSWLIALGLVAAMALPLEAQNRPPKNQPRQEQKPQRQEQHPGRDQQHASAPRNPDRPPAREPVVPNTNRPPERAHNQNRPPNAYTPPQRNLNSLSPQERQRAIENNRDFQKRTPAEQKRIKDGLEKWNRLTPEQQNHIKHDVLPKWRQLPPDRQRAIGSRLNVLQNMPESARNQHLADPNFTRGMNEEDRATLRDLAHLHVGGAPEPPNE